MPPFRIRHRVIVSVLLQPGQRFRQWCVDISQMAAKLIGRQIGAPEEYDHELQHMKST